MNFFKIFYSLTIIVALSGCAATLPAPEPLVVVKTKVVLLEIPNELLELPVPQPFLNLNNLTDGELASWIIELEKRTQTLEKQLIAIKKFQDQRKADYQKDNP